MTAISLVKQGLVLCGYSNIFFKDFIYLFLEREKEGEGEEENHQCVVAS